MSHTERSLLEESFGNAVQLEFAHQDDYNTYHATIAQSFQVAFNHTRFISVEYYNEHNVSKGHVEIHNWSKA